MALLRSQPSPGPWTSGHDGHGGIYIEDEDERQVAFVSPRHAQEANARVLVNALELLEALQGVVRVADRDTDEFIRARAAIAKATGGAA